MPRLASITSQALTGIALIAAETTEAAYSIALTTTDNVNSIGNTLYNGETATFTITAVNDTIADPGSFVAPILYWSINATTTEFVAVSDTISSTLDSHDGNTTMTSTYSLDITAASSIVGEGNQTIVLREGAVDGPVAVTYTVSIENFIPPPGNWTDDNGDPVTVASIISPIAMQVNGAFSVDPGVPFAIQGAITEAQTTITNIAANTGSLLEIDDSGNSTAFQVGEQLDIIAIEYTITPASSSINEGAANLLISVGTTNIPNGTVFYWTLSEPDQFVTSQGQFTINNNSAIVEVNAPIADATTEGAQTFTFNIRTGSVTGPIRATSDPITINDTSQAPTYTLTPAAFDVDEGSDLTVTVTTTDVPDGTTLYWDVNPLVDTFVENNGSVTITGNSATFTLTPNIDYTTETETTRLLLRDFALTGNILSQTAPITINDTYQNTLTFSTFQNVNEGSLAGWTVDGLESGVDYYWEIVADTVTNDGVSASADPAVDISGATSGTATADGTGRVSISGIRPTEDARTEGQEDARLNLRSMSSSGPIIATTLLRIGDTSRNQTATFDDGANPTIAGQGTSLTFTVSISGWLSNQRAPYRVVNGTSDSGDFTGGSFYNTSTQRGEFDALFGGTRTFGLNIASDATIGATFTVEMLNDADEVLDTTPTITITA